MLELEYRRTIIRLLADILSTLWNPQQLDRTRNVVISTDLSAAVDLGDQFSVLIANLCNDGIKIGGDTK